MICTKTAPALLSSCIDLQDLTTTNLYLNRLAESDPHSGKGSIQDRLSGGVEYQPHSGKMNDAKGIVAFHEVQGILLIHYGKTKRPVDCLSQIL